MLMQLVVSIALMQRFIHLNVAKINMALYFTTLIRNELTICVKEMNLFNFMWNFSLLLQYVKCKRMCIYIYNYADHAAACCEHLWPASVINLI